MEECKPRGEERLREKQEAFDKHQVISGGDRRPDSPSPEHQPKMRFQVSGLLLWAAMPIQSRVAFGSQGLDGERRPIDQEKDRKST